ncbi:hypothetical protein GCM10009828_011180 [Actinoplanes couchii]
MGWTNMNRPGWGVDMVGGWLRREPKKARNPETGQSGLPESAPAEAESDTTTWNGWDPSSQPDPADEPSGQMLFGGPPVTEPVQATPGSPQVYRSRRHEAGRYDEDDEPTTIFRLDQASENTTVLNLRDLGRPAEKTEPHPSPADHSEDTTVLHMPPADASEEPTMLHVRQAGASEEPTMLHVPQAGASEEPTMLHVPQAGLSEEPTMLHVRQTGPVEETTVPHVREAGLQEDLTVRYVREVGVQDELTVRHMPEVGRHEEHTVALKLGAEPQEDQTVQHPCEDDPAEDRTVVHSLTSEPPLDPDQTLPNEPVNERSEEQTLQFGRVAVRSDGGQRSESAPEGRGVDSEATDRAGEEPETTVLGQDNPGSDTSGAENATSGAGNIAPGTGNGTSDAGDGTSGSPIITSGGPIISEVTAGQEVVAVHEVHPEVAGEPEIPVEPEVAVESGIPAGPKVTAEPEVTAYPDVAARMEVTAYQGVAEGSVDTVRPEFSADPSNTVRAGGTEEQDTDGPSEGAPDLAAGAEETAAESHETATDPEGTATGPEETAAGLEGAAAGSVEWAWHSDERWVVGGLGERASVRVRVPERFRNPPADTTIDGAEVGGLVYRAASVRGVGHQERGEPRQDAYAVRFTKDQQWLVGCISDGVSSAARSHEAAAAICDRVSRALVDHLLASPPSDDPARWADEIGGVPWDRVVRSANDVICELARPYLSRAAQRRGTRLDPADPVPHAQARAIMSGTALAFVVATTASPSGVHRAMLADIAGNSAAFTVQGEQWVPLTRNESEAAANKARPGYSGSVRSLPGAAEVDARAFHLRAGAPLIMMTDGLADPLGATTGPVGRFLTDRWRTPPDLLAFAQHLAFYRETFTDDRTAIAVWPTPPADEDTNEEHRR